MKIAISKNPGPRAFIGEARLRGPPRSFAEMLGESVREYQNHAIEAAQVIEELIKLAKEMRNAQARGQELGLSDDEVAFYDALADNESAKEVMGDEQLGLLARELVERVKQNVSIDWRVRENARAQIRVMVKRILRKYGYPPDMQQRATDLVLEQAEVLCGDWSGTLAFAESRGLFCAHCGMGVAPQLAYRVVPQQLLAASRHAGSGLRP